MGEEDAFERVISISQKRSSRGEREGFAALRASLGGRRADTTNFMGLVREALSG